MLSARKNNFVVSLFHIYNRNLLRRRFHGLRARGLDLMRAQATAKDNVPMLIYMNHSSWWDALAPMYLTYTAGLEWYAMMEEKQLRQFPFFRRLGCFSVTRENPRAALESVNYAAKLIENTNRAVGIFPQGATLHNDLRPLMFYTGAAHIIKRLPVVRLMPVALRYEHLQDFRPEIFIQIGKPETHTAHENTDVKKLTAHLAECLTIELDALKQTIIENDFEGFQEVLAPDRR